MKTVLNSIYILYIFVDSSSTGLYLSAQSPLNASCDNEIIGDDEMLSLGFDDFDIMEDTSLDVTLECDTEGRKRAIGQLILKFTFHRDIPQYCNTRSCINSVFQQMRTPILNVRNAVLKGGVTVNVTTQTGTRTLEVEPAMELGRAVRGCALPGSYIRDNECSKFGMEYIIKDR